MKRAWHQRKLKRESLPRRNLELFPTVMLNANEKTSQIQTEVAIGLDGKMGIASSIEKSFNGGSRAETNCGRR